MDREIVYYNTYEALYAGEYDIVHEYIRRIIHNNETAVEDLTQDVLFVAYVKWDKVIKHPNMRGFLLKIAHNKIKKWFEKQSRIWLNEEELMEYVSFEQKRTGQVDAYQMAEFYSSAETILSGIELQMLRDYYEFGYTSAELAVKYGITESCFKVRVARMKEKLRNSMKTLMPLVMGVFINILLLWK